MFALRPTGDAADSSRSRGLVFGIGFNGALFNSPNPSGSDKDEI